MDAPKAQGQRVDQKLRNLIRAKKGRSNMDYKKILAATAAVIGTVAMAADGIVSSSVVGYQQKETVTGFNFVIPTFAAINGAGIHIQDIKIANATDWTDNIQILDEGGAGVAAYYYVSAEQSGFEADGWLSEDFTGLADINFEAGKGILIDTADAAEVTIPGVDL